MKKNDLRMFWFLPLALAVSSAQAQDPPPGPQDDGMVEITIGPDGVELGTLIQLVSKRLEINIIYDSQYATQRVQLIVPKKLPVTSLIGILQSVLKSRNLALVDGEVPTLKKIVPMQDLAEHSATVGERTEPDPANSPITRVFTLKHAEAKEAESIIKPFLSKAGLNTIPLSEHRLLIVTDFANSVKRAEQILQWVDVPGREQVVRFIPIRHLEAARLAQQVEQLLAKTQGQGQQLGSAIVADERTNQLIVVGTSHKIAEVEKLVASLDVALDVTTKTYSFQHISPERVDRLITQLLGEVTAKRIYRSVIEQGTNLLIVTTTEEIHQRVEQLKVEMDKPLTEERHPVRFYKCYNATATDVLETIQAIEEEGGGGGGGRAPAASPAPSAPSGQGTQAPAARGAGSGSFEAKGARVAVDVHSNTIIVSGPLDRQRALEALIRKLDQRRPQVLIEVTIVTLDTSGGFSLGFEIGRKSGGKTEAVTFSSFGLSTPNPTTGVLALSPATGFNGSIVNPDIGQLIVRALETSGRGKIVSTPRILVNDHATGLLSSVQQAPFTSTNQGETTSTTSFGGFSSAGTTIKVVPHIGEGDHLLLEYTVELSSFTGEGSGGVPPPRQESKLESQVRIPDGHMVIAGGLKRIDVTETESRAPFISHIPILGTLFTSQSSSETGSTLFVFLRPIVLRDDTFRDLKWLSEHELEAAELPAGFPKSEPLIMRN